MSRAAEGVLGTHEFFMSDLIPSPLTIARPRDIRCNFVPFCSGS
jgi:hypothetical protein